MNDYWIWGGLGAIDDLEEEAPRTDQEAVAVLAEKASAQGKDLTLWRRSAGGVTLVAVALSTAEGRKVIEMEEARRG